MWNLFIKLMFLLTSGDGVICCFPWGSSSSRGDTTVPRPGHHWHSRILEWTLQPIGFRRPGEDPCGEPSCGALREETHPPNDQEDWCRFRVHRLFGYSSWLGSFESSVLQRYVWNNEWNRAVWARACFERCPVEKTAAAPRPSETTS